MSKFNNIVLEALTNNVDMSKLLQLVRSELMNQCPGLEVSNDGIIKIKLFDSNYTIKLQPISIKTAEEEAAEESEETQSQEIQQNQNDIGPAVIGSLNSLSNSTNPQIAASAQQTLNGLNDNIKRLGTAFLNKTNEMLTNINK